MAAVQLCIVHMVRHSLNYVSWKLCKEIAADVKTVHAASTVDEASVRLNAFDDKWGSDYPPEIRHIIYTTKEVALKI